MLTQYQSEELTNIRRQSERLLKYGEHIEDHSVVTTALHLIDTIERILKDSINETMT